MNLIASWLVSLYVFVIPWENVVVLPGLGTAARVVGYVAGFAAAVAILIGRRVRLHPILGWTALFVVWSWLSLLWSIHLEATIVRCFTYSQLFVATWLMFHFSVRGNRLESLMWAYVLGAYVAVGATFWAYAQEMEATYLRFAAEGFDPNDLGMYLSLAMVIAWYLGLHSKHVAKLIAWGFVPVAATAVLLTASRTSALALVLASIYMLLSLNKVDWKWGVGGLALLLGVGGYLFTFLVPEYSFARILTIQEELAGGTLNWRKEIWSAGLSAFEGYPVLGAGAGCFRDAVGPYLGDNLAPHNVFLAIAVEGGVIGLVLWLGMLITASIPLWLNKHADRTFWGFLLGVLLVSFLALNFEWRKATWMVLALAAAASTRRGTVEQPSYTKAKT